MKDFNADYVPDNPRSDFYAYSKGHARWIINPYWQITETKSKTWEFTERHLRKQNPKNFQKFHFGNVTERHLRKQNPDKNTEYLVIIFIFLRFLGSSPSVIYGNKIQWNFPKES